MADRTVKIGRYEFHEKAHRHMLDGKRLTGVTTILGVLNKPNLIGWAADMAVDYVKEKAEKTTPKGPYLVSEDSLEEARKAWSKKRDKAGDWGTIVHAAIEGWIKTGSIPEKVLVDDIEVEVTKEHKKPVNLFIEWGKDKEFLESEVHVYSERMFVGGICDIIYKENGKTYLADIKTSSGIYYEAFWQMGGYHLCLEETSEVGEIDGYTVVNLPKKGGINVETNYGLTQNREAFEHCLRIYRLKNETKKTI